MIFDSKLDFSKFPVLVLAISGSEIYTLSYARMIHVFLPAHLILVHISYVTSFAYSKFTYLKSHNVHMSIDFLYAL